MYEIAWSAASAILKSLVAADENRA